MSVLQGLRAYNEVLSLDEPMTSHGDGTARGVMIPAAGPAPDELAHQALLRERVRNAIEALGRRERLIVLARFGFTGDVLTLDEVACRLGVSRERVRQLERDALLQLQAILGRVLGRRGSAPRRPSAMRGGVRAGRD